MKRQGPLILIRGGGDLASGVALRLKRAHYQVIICEVAQPLAVRRAVSFSEAIYLGECQIEGVLAVHVEDLADLNRSLETGYIPVIIDPQAAVRQQLRAEVIIDGRMLKQPSELDISAADLIIGLGPGFIVGADCHAVIETKRGHHLGRVYWEGAALENTGIPDTVAGFDVQRVVRAPENGEIRQGLAIGSLVDAGDPLARVGGSPVEAKFRGVLRGMLHDGIVVEKGLKIGDLDPRADPSYCFTVSDKALAVGGGVLEVLLTRSIFPVGFTE